MDLRTVAGRLGHGGGGTTTLKVYAAWVSAADQRAALIMLDRMPARPVPGSPIWGGVAAGDPPDGIGPQRGYELIAAGIRTAILDGTLPDGSCSTSVSVCGSTGRRRTRTTRTSCSSCCWTRSTHGRQRGQRS